MLAIAIKDLMMQFDNSNLPLGKSAIRFESLPQKLKTGKQTTSELYYQY